MLFLKENLKKKKDKNETPFYDRRNRFDRTSNRHSYLIHQQIFSTDRKIYKNIILVSKHCGSFIITALRKQII